MEMRRLIAYNFARLMKKHGKKPTHLAADYPCDTSYISQIINCSTSISLQALYQWAAIFGEPTAEFFRFPYDDISIP